MQNRYDLLLLRILRHLDSFQGLRLFFVAKSLPITHLVLTTTKSLIIYLYIERPIYN